MRKMHTRAGSRRQETYQELMKAGLFLPNKWTSLNLTWERYLLHLFQRIRSVTLNYVMRNFKLTGASHGSEGGNNLWNVECLKKEQISHFFHDFFTIFTYILLTATIASNKTIVDCMVAMCG